MPGLPDSTRIVVSPAVARELLAAARGLPRYQPTDFYSPGIQSEVRAAVRERCRQGYDELMGEVRERLDRPPYCALVRGLSFDDGDRLFVALNRDLGTLVARPYQAPRAQLVHRIQPSTDIKAVRAGKKTESERLHTDSADWPRPVAVISMICARPDRGGGGRSLILEVEALRDEIASRLGAAALARLESEPVPWQIADYLGGGVAWQPILGPRRVRWRRYTVDAALAAEGIELAPEMAEIVAAVDRLVADTAATREFLMQAGELLFAHNHRTLHARTALTDDYRTSGRLMLRSWIDSEGAAGPRVGAS